MSEVSGNSPAEEPKEEEDAVMEPVDNEESAAPAADEETENQAAATRKRGADSTKPMSADEVRRRKRSRSSPGPSESTATAQAAALSAAAAAAAAQAALAQGLSGLYALLSSTATSVSSSSSLTIPSVEQVQQAATRAINDAPPYVHLSSRDSAPQLKIEDGPSGKRMLLKGGMRGYRMARASHGPSDGNYYYEVLVLPPPPIRQIIDGLPPNVRLGKNLQKQLEEQLTREEQQKTGVTSDQGDEASKNSKKRRRGDDETPPQTIGGNVRIGWSMRTGDLQAPVGYDKWSYGLRDISGSRIHSSKREDHWGGEPFGPGDVVGFAICLVDKETKSSSDSSKKPAVVNNHIRFFKNGEAMGHFVLSRGKREGGAAFDEIQDGTYYPAISTYLGGTVKVNFGPYFCCPPRSLPSGLKLRPVSELCKAPIRPEDAVVDALKDRIFKKTDDAIVTAIRNAVLTEAQIRYEAHREHLKRHLEEIRATRAERNLSTSDLPEAVEDE